jgi:putative transposase
VTSIFNAYGQKNSNNELFQVWQSDNRPMQITTSKFAMQKVAYIHLNPVKAGIVDNLEEYLYSSARNYAGRKDYLIEVELLDLLFTL